MRKVSSRSKSTRLAITMDTRLELTSTGANLENNTTLMIDRVVLAEVLEI